MRETEIIKNNEIKCENVRVIGEDGKQLGIIPTVKAIKMAKNRKIDLIMINPNGNPPVCRLVKLSKYKYEQDKINKEKRKKQKAAAVEVKELRIGVNIDKGDINTKAKQASKFLAKGNKVKLVLKYKGREITFKDQGERVIESFLNAIETEFNVESKKSEGNSTTLMLVVKK